MFLYFPELCSSYAVESDTATSFGKALWETHMPGRSAALRRSCMAPSAGSEFRWRAVKARNGSIFMQATTLRRFRASSRCSYSWPYFLKYCGDAPVVGNWQLGALWPERVGAVCVVECGLAWMASRSVTGEALDAFARHHGARSDSVLDCAEQCWFVLSCTVRVCERA